MRTFRRTGQRPWQGVGVGAHDLAHPVLGLFLSEILVHHDAPEAQEDDPDEDPETEYDVHAISLTGLSGFARTRQRPRTDRHQEMR